MNVNIKMQNDNSKLKLSKKEVMNYCFENKYATMRFFEASNDYVAARCCILNGLFPGFTLACQAIEKILKAFIYLESKEQKHIHDTFKLKEELKKIKDYKIDRYDNLFKKLYNHYLSRYHEYNNDYKDQGFGASSDELETIDELWIDLVEKLPMSNEVKYRMKFFTDLFESSPYWNDRYWIMQKNRHLTKKFEVMKKQYKEVFQHLYPNYERTK